MLFAELAGNSTQQVCRTTAYSKASLKSKSSSTAQLATGTACFRVWGWLPTDKQPHSGEMLDCAEDWTSSYSNCMSSLFIHTHCVTMAPWATQRQTPKDHEQRGVSGHFHSLSWSCDSSRLIHGSLQPFSHLKSPVSSMMGKCWAVNVSPAADDVLLAVIFLWRLRGSSCLVLLHYPHSSCLHCSTQEFRGISKTNTVKVQIWNSNIKIQLTRIHITWPLFV